ncbi:MAG: tetratricopeptide repeat protein [Candidatus Hinthialibacter antarcticus]|nr:tetratricopeptide repeat protein [Candidatus Hinthialibacter antarcticus]
MPVLLIGCVTTDGKLNDQSFESQLDQADKYYERGNYQRAQLLYSGYVYSSFSNQERIDYALYQLGLCHYLMGEYRDAFLTLNEVVTKYPNFDNAPQAKLVIAKCQVRLQSEKETITERAETIHQKMAQYQKFIEESPTNAEYQFKLGDLYWQSGQFSEAVSAYQRAAELDPDYLRSNEIRQRVRITQDGRYVLRDPMLDIQQDQVMRVDARLDRIYRDNWLGEYQAVRISGFVQNEGLRDVSDAQVEVSVYDFYDTVQGTKVVHLGFVPAGGKRAFTALFDEFSGESIDIKKYTTQVFYSE